MGTMLLDLEGDSFLYLHGLAITLLVTLLILLGLGASGEADPRHPGSSGDEDPGTPKEPLR